MAVRLGARDVAKSYGAVRANSGITLEVAPAEIHAIVGENGAGKSTLMRLLQGLEQPDAGSIVFNDRPIRLRDPEQALGLGIGMVHQEFMLAPELTLLENFVLGHEPVTAALPLGRRIDWRAARAAGDALAVKTDLAIDWDRRAGTAPVHIQQYTEILRLLQRGMKVLILDEPTAVLAPQQADDLFTLLRQLRDQGTSIVFISHKLREVIALADRVTIMRRGRVVASSRIDETDIDTMTRHIVGEAASVAPPAAAVRAAAGAPVLDVTGLSAPAIAGSHPVRAVDLQVRSGEIVGMAGIAGNGQDEFIQCVVGLRKPSSGAVGLNGRALAGRDNADFRAAGLGYISPDRAHEGLAKSASIEDNVMAASQRAPAFRRGPFRRLGAVRAEAFRRLSQLKVRFGRLSDPVASLSGGNQQRLVFAREIATEPALLVVAQPTRGVDLGGIAAIHAILRDFAARGGAVLLVSEELDELIALSDRIVVMAEGAIVGEIADETATPEAIGRLMLQQDSHGEAANG
ncbi:ABC transporter ATP-binding protein [Nitratireductor sp. StC3]|uniref:ABC transporter ATP-binding protein n=1 Tax=Nitratireductor sp. StC3 TaxID=2126741 RepID=UPI001304EF9C|nr:ABC transporter ATP-binding protein [Nitratireductor sp. StC3]